MTAIRKFFWTVTLLSLFVIVPTASAHRPETGGGDGLILIPSSTTSYAYYQEIRAPDQIDGYQFEAPAGQFFHAGINIPQLPRLENYGVTLALVGPGLPPFAAADAAAVGSDDHEHTEGEDSAHHHGKETDLAAIVSQAGLPEDGLGGLVLPSVESEEFYEPFTQTRYWGRQVLELDLPESGTYYLFVWNPDGETGKYVLDTGTEEVFGPTDLLRFPIWWLDARLYFEQGPQLFASLALVLSAVFGILLYRRRR